MEKFKIESRYLKLCNEFTAVIRYMKAVFYRPDYQKLLMCPLIKRPGLAFVLKHAAEPLKGSAELLKHSAKILRFSEETKSSAVCFCYNVAHAIPTSHSSFSPLFHLPWLLYPWQ